MHTQIHTRLHVGISIWTHNREENVPPYLLQPSFLELVVDARTPVSHHASRLTFTIGPGVLAASSDGVSPDCIPERSEFSGVLPFLVAMVLDLKSPPEKKGVDPPVLGSHRRIMGWHIEVSGPASLAGCSELDLTRFGFCVVSMKEGGGGRAGDTHTCISWPAPGPHGLRREEQASLGKGIWRAGEATGLQVEGGDVTSHVTLQIRAPCLSRFS